MCGSSLASAYHPSANRAKTHKADLALAISSARESDRKRRRVVDALSAAN
jgi:hypothetical protein